MKVEWVVLSYEKHSENMYEITLKIFFLSTVPDIEFLVCFYAIGTRDFHHFLS